MRISLSPLCFCLYISLIGQMQAGMSFEEARHLLARCGFGGTGEQIQTLMKDDYGTAVKRMVTSGLTKTQVTPPDWIKDDFRPNRGRKNTSAEEKNQVQRQMREHWVELKDWWYQEMIVTDNPLQERMTLFWHNHFTSSLRKVKSPQLMYEQNQTLRKNAMGNFQTLLHDIAKDPAMIIYLDSRTNIKGQPNENFAREVLELFTLGEGHYTEADIKNAARAFTGWNIDHEGNYRFVKRQHDDGHKEFMRQKGKLSGEDILDIILRNPQVSIYLSEKLWKEFVSDTPDAKEVQRLAAVLLKNKYEIKPWLTALFMSPQFRAIENRGTMIKSPTDLIVGIMRVLKVSAEKGKNFSRVGRLLGQDLFDPPNVKGWEGGKAWITSSRLLDRQFFLSRVMRDQDIKSAEIAEQLQEPVSSQTMHMIQKVLLAIPPVDAIIDNTTMASPRLLIATLVLDPAYQLK